MEQTDQGQRTAAGSALGLGRMQTGAKVFLILGTALLPLALIAFFASLQTTRTVDLETRARLSVAISESAGTLGSELRGDLGALREALTALEREPDKAPACARLMGAFATQIGGGAAFAIQDRGGRLICGAPTGGERIPAPPPGGIQTAFRADHGLDIVITSDNGSFARAFFPSSFLSEVAQPSGFMPSYGAWLVNEEGDTLTIHQIDSGGPLARSESADVPLGIDALRLSMNVRSAPITSPVLIAMLLPFLMWIAAAVIGWFVVDRLLIRPLRRLRTSVGEYQPGEVIEAGRFRSLPAQEIRELGDTFREMARTVQVHETDLAEGLIRQTRLTREVHHRVKNNLQVIASLINFHARGAEGKDVAAAYASIQRRVDALAVVHRYHYAGYEDVRGLELRSVIGELASNIRATAPEESAGLGINLEVEPLLVSQDTAVAIAFLVTELLELAMGCNPIAQIRISIKHDANDPAKATLRVSSTALVESATLQHLLETRYGRVLTGLVRQLRTAMHHDPLVGAYELQLPIQGAA